MRLRLATGSKRLVLGLAVCLFAVMSGSAGATPGDLDPSFGEGGLVTTEMGESIHGRVAGLAVQADGKIVAAGDCTGTLSGFPAQHLYCLARYETDGSLDSSFGTGGKVMTTFQVGGRSAQDGGIALQEDGKIVVADSCPIIENGLQVAQVFCVLRFNTDGSLDDVGSTRIGRIAYADEVTIQPDGKIVLAGWCQTTGINAFCLARFDPDLTLDTTWGGDFEGGFGCMIPVGELECDFVYPPGTVAWMVAQSNVTAASDVVVQPDGKVVAVGSCHLKATTLGEPVTSFFCLARWGASGHDRTVTTEIEAFAEATSAVMQPDGKIVVAGSCTSLLFGGVQFCIARYNPDLSLDSSFGTGGVTEPIDEPLGEFPYEVALQPDGKLVVAGACPAFDFCLRRYSADGSLDSSYGTDGKATADFGSNSQDLAYALAFQEDGKSVAAGACSFAAFCLARFDAEPVESTLTGITVTPANPTIANGTNQQFTATATYVNGSTADLTSSVTWASATLSVATISAGGLAHALAEGTSTITATLGGVSGDTLLTVALTPQTITFDPLADKAYGDLDFTVSATASSGLPVSFAAAGNCTTGGSSVHITGAGNCTITASQSGNTSYAAAPSVSRTFSIAKAGQTIMFAALANKRFGDPDFTITAIASSRLAVAFSARGRCTIAGARVHLTGAGSCTITASQGGDANYNAAPAVSRTFSIAQRSCTVPRVIGKLLPVARSMLATGHCRTGVVTRVYSRTRRRGVVIGQSRRPGRVLPAHSKIDLVVSRGRRR